MTSRGTGGAFGCGERSWSFDEVRKCFIPGVETRCKFGMLSPIEGLVRELGYQGRWYSNAVFGNPSAGPDRGAVLMQTDPDLDHLDAHGHFV